MAWEAVERCSFLQDNAPVLRANKIMNVFMNLVFELLDQPLDSLDLLSDYILFQGKKS